MRRRRAFADDLVAEGDALVANEDPWSGHQAIDLIFCFAAERTTLVDTPPSHDFDIVSRDHWERQASNWAAWARRPDFDAYWQYSPAFFELVPPPRGLTLDVGCGEGRVARDLAGRGHQVIGVDTTMSLVRLAHEGDPSGAYLRCDAACLPFRSESFGLVVFYNSLMDVDDMEASVREASRVLRPGGNLCVCVTHPTMDAGNWTARDAGAEFVIAGSYLGGRRWIDLPVTERGGLTMHFAGWAYPLESYARALEDAGFVIESLREPAVPPSEVERDPAEERWRRVPMFLMWRARKVT